MVRLAPFRALRPHPGLAARIAAPPYDVVTLAEARAMGNSNPYCFLHVTRPEIDLPEGSDPHDAAAYERGLQNLERMIRDGALLSDAAPSLYIYRQVLKHRAQIGVVGCLSTDEYARNVIRRHEFTRKDKEDDRTRHIRTLDAHTGPVFVAYRDQKAVDDLVAEDVNQRPLYHFDAADDVTHTVWAARDPRPYVEAFARLDAAYVADGHHRAAAATRVAEERRAAGLPSGEHDWFLAGLLPASQTRILAYNRVVRDLGRHRTSAEFLSALANLGKVTPTTDPVPNCAGVMCICIERSWHRLELNASLIPHADPVKSLDVSLLHDLVLGPLLSVGDPRTDPRVDFVGGARGAVELESLIAGGRWAAGFSLFPTTIEQLMRVSDAGLVMPPKSTWFEPKLRSGLLVHRLH